MLRIRKRVAAVAVWAVVGAVLACAAAAAGAGEPRQWKPGDRVLALWKPDKDWYYTGTIRQAQDGQYLVVFDDGDKDLVAVGDIYPEDIAVGDKVAGNFKRKGVYYPGKVTSRNGDQIHIKYDDGDDEDTTVAMVRVKRPRP